MNRAATWHKICGWCGRVLEEGGADDARVTHGICPECRKAWCADAKATVEKYRQQDNRKGERNAQL